MSSQVSRYCQKILPGQARTPAGLAAEFNSAAETSRSGRPREGRLTGRSRLGRGARYLTQLHDA